MKFLIAICVFILTIALTTKTIASEPEAACNGESESKCAPSEIHSAKGGHEDLSQKMNSLFPIKQKIAKFSKRPAVVELMGPKFLAKITGTAKLEWKAASGANAYHVQVATDPNFKWVVAEDHSVKATTFDFTKAEAGQKYFWRVAALNTDNDSMYTKSNFSGSVFVAK